MIGYGPTSTSAPTCSTSQDGGPRARWARSSSAPARRWSAPAGARVALVSSGDAGRPRHGRAHARASPTDVEVTVDPRRDRRARRRRAPRRAARRRLGDALAVGPPPRRGRRVERRAHRARRLRHRARALQPALARRAPSPSTARWRSCASTAPRDTPVVVATDVARAGETHRAHDARRRSTRRRVTMRSLVLVAGETGGPSRPGDVADAPRARHDRPPRRRRAGRSPRCSRSRPRRCSATRGWSSTTGRRWTRSSRSRPPTRERHCVGRAPGQRALAAARGQRAAGRARPDDGTSCGSRAATRSSPRAAARRPSRCSDAGIDVNVVPGVSSALAAPAAAGIPLMLRQLSRHRDVRRRQRRPRARRAARLGRARPARRHARDPHRPRADHPPDRGEADRRRARSETRPIAAISAAARAPSSRCCAARSPTLPAPLPPPVTFVVGAAAALDLVACTSPTAS